jgi:histidine triad (HIT) family protein
MEDCIFCKIIKKELPADVEYEDEDLMVFRNIKPLAPVHLLIVPKKHIVNISQVAEEDINLMGKMVLTAKKMAEKMGIIDAFRTATANGENAGQSVYHMHLHLTGGWKTKYNRDEDKA